jgi:hypothetical protein
LRAPPLVSSGQTQPLSSLRPATKLAAFTKAPVPVVSGTVTVGKTLTAKAGTWAPKPTGVSYQWKRAGKSIAGATRSSYVVRPVDAGVSLTVTVSVTRAGYISTARQSMSSGKAAGLVYKNCAALTAAYPHGVAKAGVKNNMVSGKPRALKGPPFFSSAVYALNTKSDRDKDHIACER